MRPTLLAAALALALALPLPRLALADPDTPADAALAPRRWKVHRHGRVSYGSLTHGAPADRAEAPSRRVAGTGQ